jgi:hypothetical protein
MARMLRDAAVMYEDRRGLANSGVARGGVWGGLASPNLPLGG